jgi:hypothetical protein
MKTEGKNIDNKTTDIEEKCQRCGLKREEIRNKQLICQKFGEVFEHHIYK